MTHTPGPWKVEHNKFVEIKGDTGEWSSMIAHVYRAGKTNGNEYQMPVEENARLIAAAPRMLSALNVVETAIRGALPGLEQARHLLDGYVNQPVSHSMHQLESALAVVKKAKMEAIRG